MGGASPSPGGDQAQGLTMFEDHLLGPSPRSGQSVIHRLAANH